MSSQTYPSRYEERERDRRIVPMDTTDPFALAKTLSLYQHVEDVVIGTGRDENGEIYEMRVPIASDLYYSSEFGGVHQKHSMKDWKSTNKEIIVRGWNYQGREYSRATKDGREFAAYMQDCLMTIETSVNEHFSPHKGVEYVTIKVTPWWAYLTLLTTIISILLIVLIISRP